ncbi:hypothetical protein [Ornithinibacillus xuwenensis]|uniref:Uncharacterized protein n=1 Tax=Ornithinibacillus xuwenensis TaxID=3144668 RepID=A0ABU9XID7_9BACI
MELNELTKTIIQSSDKELIGYISQKFHKENDIQAFSNNIRNIKELDKEILYHGISRMIKIEESFDILKVTPVVVTFLLAILAGLSGLTEEILEPIKDYVSPNAINLLVMISFFALIGFQIMNIRHNRSIAAYFKSLLELHKQ